MFAIQRVGSGRRTWSSGGPKGATPIPSGLRDRHVNPVEPLRRELRMNQSDLNQYLAPCSVAFKPIQAGDVGGPVSLRAKSAVAPLEVFGPYDPTPDSIDQALLHRSTTVCGLRVSNLHAWEPTQTQKFQVVEL